MKNLINNIIKAKTWQERVELVEDKYPDTEFNEWFKAVERAKVLQKIAPQEMQNDLLWLGGKLANLITRRDHAALKRMSKALRDWKWHKPKPDHALATFFSMTGMFPPGWKNSFGIAQHPRTVAMRDIEQSLRRRKPTMSAEEWERARKKIQRYASRLRIPMDKSPGAPTKKLRQD